MPTRIERFMAKLDLDDFAAAAGEFAHDGTYIIPTLNGDGLPNGQFTRAEGRQQIEAFFVARGSRPYRHEITAVVSAGDREFVEGYVVMASGSRQIAFLATAALTDDTLIKRYVVLGTTLGAGGAEALA